VPDARRRPSIGDTSKVYGWLLENEQRALAAGGVLPWTPEEPSYTAAPQRLAALRGGRSVDLPASALPSEARPGVLCRSWTQAVVQPDGAIAYHDDDGSQFVAEKEL
jgi:hypothetical protein